MDLKSKIILISGPTASGKSNFAIKLAKKINGEIINADSMQIYSELNVLSARPTINDQKKMLYRFLVLFLISGACSFLYPDSIIPTLRRVVFFQQSFERPNPFEFEYTESTISGYRIGIKLGNGMILNYIFRQSFRDIDGDGDVNGKEET